MRLSEQHTRLNLAMFYYLLNNIISLITAGHSLESKLIYVSPPHRPIYKILLSAMSCRPALYPNNQWFLILTVLLFL